MNELDDLYYDSIESRLKGRISLGFYDDFSETLFTKQASHRSTMLHEMYHHLTYSTTPYGAMVSFWNYIRDISIGKFFNSIYAEVKGPIQVPLVNWVKKISAKGLIKRETGFEFQRFRFLSLLKAVFEGEANYELKSLLNMFQKYQSSLGDFEMTLLPSAKIKDDMDSDIYGNNACPKFLDSGLGGMHILEALAWVTEVGDLGINSLPIKNNSSAAIGQAKLKFSEPYHNAFILYVSKSHPDFLKEALDNALITMNLSIPFLVVAHTALLTPIHPFFNNLIKSDTSWYDLHPGWRFVRICEITDRIPVLYPDFSNYEEIQNYICNYFDWPLPSSFRKFSKHMEKEGFLKSYNMSENFEPQCFVRSCKAFVDSEQFPWAFLFSPKSYEGFKGTPYQDIINNALLKYPPTFIGADFNILPGWKANNRNWKYKLFKKNLRGIINNKIRSFLGIKEFPEEYFEKTFSLLNYLYPFWIEYIMYREVNDCREFFKYAFPMTDPDLLSIDKQPRNPNQDSLLLYYSLVSLINFGSIMYCCRPLDDFINCSSKAPIFTAVPAIPPLLENKKLRELLKSIHYRTYD